MGISTVFFQLVGFGDGALRRFGAGALLDDAGGFPAGSIQRERRTQYHHHRRAADPGERQAKERVHLRSSVSHISRSMARRLTRPGSIWPPAHTHCGLPLSAWFIARQAPAQSPALNRRAVADRQ